MLVIRLSRTGRKKLASYRIVAADSRRSASSKFVQQLGHYNPHTKELVLKKEQIQSYIEKGAQPSSTMVKLLKREKLTLPKWAESNLKTRKRSAKTKATAESAAAPAAAPIAPAKADEPAAAAQEPKAEEAAEQKAAPAPAKDEAASKDSAKPEDAKESAAPEQKKAEAPDKARAEEPKPKADSPESAKPKA